MQKIEFCNKLAFPLSQSTDSLASLGSIETDISESAVDAKKYKRISNDVRNQLLHKIFFQNKRIKQAAHELNINYSSAKTILHLFRKKFRKDFQQTDAINMCKYRQLLINEQSTCQLMITQGGRFYDTVQNKSKKIKKNKKNKEIENQDEQFIEVPTQQFQQFSMNQQQTDFSNLNQQLLQQILALLPCNKIQEEVEIFQQPKQNIYRKNIIIKNIDPKIFNEEE